MESDIVPSQHCTERPGMSVLHSKALRYQPGTSPVAKPGGSRTQLHAAEVSYSLWPESSQWVRFGKIVICGRRIVNIVQVTHFAG